MQPDERLVFPYESVLVPTDGSAGASHVAEHGLSLAASLDATVHALSVVDDTSLGLDVRSTVSGPEQQAATDAVVMGTTGRRGTDRILLGSVAEKTVRSAPVPVPVVTVGRGE
jgi:nucleotide-binding universal stress UspA family protein